MGLRVCILRDFEVLERFENLAYLLQESCPHLRDLNLPKHFADTRHLQFLYRDLLRVLHELVDLNRIKFSVCCPALLWFRLAFDGCLEQLRILMLEVTVPVSVDVAHLFTDLVLEQPPLSPCPRLNVLEIAQLSRQPAFLALHHQVVGLNLLHHRVLEDLVVREDVNLKELVHFVHVICDLVKEVFAVYEFSVLVFLRVRLLLLTVAARILALFDSRVAT